MGSIIVFEICCLKIFFNSEGPHQTSVGQPQITRPRPVLRTPGPYHCRVSLTEQCIPGAQVSTFESAVWFAAHAASSSSYVHT